MQFFRKMEPFNNVVATGRAVLSSKLVLGNVVERIVLQLGGTFTKAMITAIRVRLNGKVIFGDISGTVLDLVQRYTLLNNTATFLTIDFTEPLAKSIQGQLMGALNLNALGVSDFTIEVDIAGATAPTLDAYVQMRAPSSMTAAKGFDENLGGVLRALIPTTIPSSAAGEIQADVNYGAGGNSLLKRLYISSTILTSFRCKRDSLDIYDATATALATYLALDYGRVAQANLYVADWLVDGNQSDAVPTRRPDRSVSNFQFLFTASGAGSHLVFADVYTTLQAL